MSSTSYPESAQDWRGRFIANLAAGLARRPDLALSLWTPPGELPAQAAGITTDEEERWLRRLQERGGIAHLLRQHKFLALATATGLLARMRKAYRRSHVDVVHVNWLQNALPLWGTTTPAVISVLGTDFALLRLPGMKPLLRSVFNQRRTILAPNAQWMVPELTRLFGDVAIIHPVSFGVDESWFALRRDVPQNDEHHWLAITRLTKNKIGDLFDWGDGLFGASRTLHLFGPMQEKIALPSWIQYHGSTHPAALLDTWFPRASGLITLSRHDEGRPQVMLEAMAAGLPVIASDLPAHRDIIAHRHTGWLAKSSKDFGHALTYMEQPEQNLLTGAAARAWAKKSMGTWDDCAARYAILYAQLLRPPA
ncbi:MAG: glycosyltransferase family 4 protein [Pseudomonadota bacterium]